MIISRDFFSTHRLLPCGLTQLADYDAVRRSWVEIQEFSLTLCGPNAMTKANVQADVRIYCHCTLPTICLLLIHESHLFELRLKTCVILAVFFFSTHYLCSNEKGLEILSGLSRYYITSVENKKITNWNCEDHILKTLPSNWVFYK